MRIGGKQRALHRWLYTDKYGAIPKGGEIRRSCDNKLCLAEAHINLYLPGAVQDRTPTTVLEACGFGHRLDDMEPYGVRPGNPVKQCRVCVKLRKMLVLEAIELGALNGDSKLAVDASWLKGKFVKYVNELMTNEGIL
jgi:hypothetical protein